MQIEKNTLTPEQQEMEAALGALRPGAPAIDRDALLFAAGEAVGRAAASRGALWPWKVAACAGFLCSTILLGVQWHGLPAPRPSVLATAEKRIAPTAPTAGADFQERAVPAGIASYFVDAPADNSPWAYHTMLSTVLAHGLDAIPVAPNGGSNPDQATPARETAAFPLRYPFFKGDHS